MTEYVSEAARGTSILMGQSAVSGILRILNIMILTRFLLQMEMGAVALLSIIYGFTQFLGAMGLNHASPLIIPQEESEGRIGKIKSYLKRGSLIVFLSSLTLMIILVMISPFITGSGFLSTTLLNVAIIIIPFSALETFLDSFLLGRYSVRNLAVGRLAFDFVRIIATVGLVWLGFGLLGVIVGWLLSEATALLIFGYASTRNLKSPSSAIDMRPVLAFALPSLLFQTIDVTIQNTDRLILLVVTDLTVLGVYDVLLSLLFMMSFISLAISTSLFPILTRYRISIEKKVEADDDIGVAVSVMVRYVLIMLLPLSVILSLNAFSVLEVLFGLSYASFPNASLSFSLLLITYSLWGVTYALHTVLRAMNEAKFFLLSGLAIITIEIIGCWYLTQYLGLFGSALIRCSYIFLLFLTAWARLKQRGVSWTKQISKSVVRITLSAIPAGFLLLLLMPTNLLYMALSLFLAGIVYLLCLFLLREINPFDFKLARSLLPHPLHGSITKLQNLYGRYVGA